MSGAVPGGSPLNELSGRQPAGRALLQPFYLSPEIYRNDIELMLMRHWLCVGHESAIRDSGSYFVFEIDRESVIIIRDNDGVVRGLINVCRHRGSRICYDASGKAKRGLLVCPYHAWAYTIDGAHALPPSPKRNYRITLVMPIAQRGGPAFRPAQSLNAQFILRWPLRTLGIESLG